MSDENDAVKAVVSKPTTRQTYVSNYAGDDVVEYASDKDEYPNNRYWFAILFITMNHYTIKK